MAKIAVRINSIVTTVILKNRIDFLNFLVFLKVTRANRKVRSADTAIKMVKYFSGRMESITKIIPMKQAEKK